MMMMMMMMMKMVVGFIIKLRVVRDEILIYPLGAFAFLSESTHRLSCLGRPDASIFGSNILAGLKIEVKALKIAVKASKVAVKVGNL